jgi:5-hydroxyisourate hydrolase-like protein (transthyretin family)
MVVAVGAALALPAAAGAATPGSIGGKVTSAATGQPVFFLEVCAYASATHGFEGCDSTDFEGNYLIEGLAAGSYKVEFQGSEFAFEGGYFTQWYNGKPSFETANAVAVTEGNTTSGINAAMQERGGKISGAVTDAASGAPVGGIQVCAGRNSSEGYFFYEECVRTDASGQYTLAHLIAGSFRVSFSSAFKYNEATGESELDGPNYVAQYFNGKAHGEEGDLVTVVDGSTTSGINAALQPAATITGTVTDATTGAALQGVGACAWGSLGFYCDTTDAAGHYAIQTIASGQYKVEFDPYEYFIKYTPGQPEKEHWMRSDYSLMEYARQYYNNKFAFAAADTLTAVSGGTISGIDAKMTKETQPPAPKAKVGTKVKVKGGKALLRISCASSSPCKGNVKLSARAKSQGKTKKVLIGKDAFGIPPGKTKTVAVKLNGKGKSLLKTAGKKGLKATVAGTGLTPGKVTLVGQSTKKTKGGKKH